MGPEQPPADQPEPNPRIARIANLVGDMPGEPFLQIPTVQEPVAQKHVLQALTPEQQERMWQVFPQAKRQFRNLLRGRGLEGKIPDDLLGNIELEGAVNAAHRAKDGRLTPAFMSTSMKWALGRHWRKPEVRAGTDQLGDDAEEVQGPLVQGVPNVAPEPADREVQEHLKKLFLRQPSLSKRRIYFAVKVKGESAKEVGDLFRHSGTLSYRTAEVNRVVKQVQRDVDFTRRTGQYRDRQIKKALMKCIPDDRHREALELNLTHGMSTRQLGEKYNVSHVAVYKWIRTGKERLIAYLHQHQPQELLESVLAQFKAAPR